MSRTLNPFVVHKNGDIRLSRTPDRQYSVREFVTLVEHAVKFTRVAGAWWKIEPPFNISDEVARVLRGPDESLVGFSALNLVVVGQAAADVGIEAIDHEGRTLAVFEKGEAQPDEAGNAHRVGCLMRIRGGPVTFRVTGDGIEENEYITELFDFNTTVPLGASRQLPLFLGEQTGESDEVLVREFAQWLADKFDGDAGMGTDTKTRDAAWRRLAAEFLAALKKI
jgi:hypothetical protein